MKWLINTKLKKILYEITNNHIEYKQSALLNFWIFAPIGLFCLYLFGKLTGAEFATIVSYILFAVYIFLTLAYLYFDVKHDTTFLKFKKWSQKKDEPFEVRHIASIRKEEK